MNTIALALIFTFRILVPGTLLITLGEWVRRREIKYWLHR